MHGVLPQSKHLHWLIFLQYLGFTTSTSSIIIDVEALFIMHEAFHYYYGQTVTMSTSIPSHYYSE